MLRKMIVTIVFLITITIIALVLIKRNQEELPPVPWKMKVNTQIKKSKQIQFHEIEAIKEMSILTINRIMINME